MELTKQEVDTLVDMLVYYGNKGHLGKKEIEILKKLQRK